MINDEDIKRLEEIFVTRRECNTTVDEINRKLANDSTRLAVIDEKLERMTWLLRAVAGGIIAVLIKLFFGV